MFLSETLFSSYETVEMIINFVLVTPIFADYLTQNEESRIS